MAGKHAYRPTDLEDLESRMVLSTVASPTPVTLTPVEAKLVTVANSITAPVIKVCNSAMTKYSPTITTQVQFVATKYDRDLIKYGLSSLPTSLDLTNKLTPVAQKVSNVQDQLNLKLSTYWLNTIHSYQ